MAMRVTIGDRNEIMFQYDDITAIQAMSNTPNGKAKIGDCKDGLKISDFKYDVKPGGGNARSADFGLGVKIWGRINFAGTGNSWEDNTVKVAEWALQPSDALDAYRKVEVEVYDGGQYVRKYEYNKAFVVEYSEELDDETGMGHFYLHVRQKKDFNIQAQVDGGYAK